MISWPAVFGHVCNGDGMRESGHYVQQASRFSFHGPNFENVFGVTVLFVQYVYSLSNSNGDVIWPRWPLQ